MSHMGPIQATLRFSILLGLLGCLFKGQSQSVPTFHRDIAPIIQQKCLPCHFEGGSAPFSLVNYGEVSQKARFIEEVTARRYMPPWPADPGYVSHSNARYLTDTEIGLIRDWVAAGSPKGKKESCRQKRAAKAILAPKIPGLALKAEAPYQVPPDRKDHFVYFLLADTLSSDMDVQSFRFLPGNLRVVHHIELLVAPPGTLPETPQKVIDEGDYYGDLFTQEFGRSFEYIAGWLPGNEGEIYPRNCSRTLKKGSRLVLMVHYAPTPVPESDWTELELFLAPRSSKFEVQSLDLHGASHLVDGPLFLPANSKKEFHAAYRVKEDFFPFAVFPHAHHLCVEMKAYAKLPSGEEVPLLSIPKWDFDWQFTYYFDEFLHFPPGTIVHFSATYDNTANNPENPFHPPQDIPSSFRSNDEMMELFVWGIRASNLESLPRLKFE